MLYASKLIDPLWLVVASQQVVPEFGRLNRLLLSTCNVLAVQARGCVLRVPPGDLVLRITQCVHDDEEIIVFFLVCFRKK